MLKPMKEKAGYVLIDAIEVLRPWVATLQLPLTRLHALPVAGGVIAEVNRRLMTALSEDTLSETFKMLRDSSALAALLANNLAGSKTGKYITATSELTVQMTDMLEGGGGTLYKFADPNLASTLFAANSTPHTSWILTTHSGIGGELFEAYSRLLSDFKIGVKPDSAEKKGLAQASFDVQIDEVSKATNSFGKLMQIHLVSNLLLDPNQLSNVLPISASVATASGLQKRKLSLQALAAFWHAADKLPALFNLRMFEQSFKTIDALFGPFPIWAPMQTAESLIKQEVDPFDIFNVSSQIDRMTAWLTDPNHPRVKGIVRDYLTPDFVRGLDGISESAEKDLDVTAPSGVKGAWSPSTRIGIKSTDMLDESTRIQRMTPELRALLVDAPVASMAPVVETSAIVNLISNCAAGLMGHAFIAAYENRLFMAPEAVRELKRVMRSLNVPAPLPRCFIDDVSIVNGRTMGSAVEFTIGGIFSAAHSRMSAAINLGGAYGESSAMTDIVRSWQTGQTFFDDLQRDLLVSNLSETRLGMYMPTFLTDSEGAFEPDSLKTTSQLFTLLTAATGTDVPYLLELLDAPVSAKLLATSLSSFGVVSAGDSVIEGYGMPYGCSFLDLATHYTGFKRKGTGLPLDEGGKFRFYPIERMPIIEPDARFMVTRILSYGPFFGVYPANHKVGYDANTNSFTGVSKEVLPGIPIPGFGLGKAYAHYFLQPMMSPATYGRILFSRLTAHRSAGVVVHDVNHSKKSATTSLGLQTKTWPGPSTTFGLQYYAYDPVIAAGPSASDITPDQTAKELMDMVEQIESEVADKSRHEAAEVDSSAETLAEAERTLVEVTESEVAQTKEQSGSSDQPGKGKKKKRTSESDSEMDDETSS